MQNNNFNGYLSYPIFINKLLFPGKYVINLNEINPMIIWNHTLPVQFKNYKLSDFLSDKKLNVSSSYTVKISGNQYHDNSSIPQTQLSIKNNNNTLYTNTYFASCNSNSSYCKYNVNSNFNLNGIPTTLDILISNKCSNKISCISYDVTNYYFTFIVHLQFNLDTSSLITTSNCPINKPINNSINNIPVNNFLIDNLPINNVYDNTIYNII